MSKSRIAFAAFWLVGVIAIPFLIQVFGAMVALALLPLVPLVGDTEFLGAIPFLAATALSFGTLWWVWICFKGAVIRRLDGHAMNGPADN